MRPSSGPQPGHVAGTLKSFLVKGASGSFLLRMVSVGVAFLSGVVLARLLGSGGFGAYSYAMAWAALLAIPGSLGLKIILVRQMAVYTSRSEWSLARGLLGWANRMSGLASVTIAVLAASIAWWVLPVESDALRICFVLAMLVVPFQVSGMMREGALWGLHRVVLSQVPSMVIRPLLFLALLGVAYLYLGERFSPVWATGLAVAAWGVSVIVGAVILIRCLPRELSSATPAYDAAAWVKSMVPLIMLGGTQIVVEKTDIVMLGILADTEAVGLYTVARRGADLALFVLVAANTALTSVVAKLYADGEHDKLCRVITRSARIVLAATFPIALGLMIFGHWFLLLFGPEFPAGHTALVLLCAGTLFNAATGSVGTLLSMTGNERDVLGGFTIGAVANVLLNFLLIPRWGLEGAAVATAVSMILWNSVLAWTVWVRLGIDPTAAGFKKRKQVT